MTDNEMIRGLRAVAKKYEGKPVATFETNISAMASDAANHIERLCDENNRQKVEIERLSKDYVDMRIKYGLVKCSSEIIKSEAIQEFAERLKDKLGNTDLAIRFIDNLVKEMVGE